jgi:hypothetical protein
MSTLWTPSGEHPVDREPDAPQVAAQNRTAPPVGDESLEDAEAEVAALREQLAATPAQTVLANHCYGLFELGAIYLSTNPPLLPEARLAIDAFGLLVEGLGDRLGDATTPLRDALAQIRLGFVQVEAALRAANGSCEAIDGQPTE